jgi:hypothetical protein
MHEFPIKILRFLNAIIISNLQITEYHYLLVFHYKLHIFPGAKKFSLGIPLLSREACDFVPPVRSHIYSWTL